MKDRKLLEATTERGETPLGLSWNSTPAYVGAWSFGLRIMDVRLGIAQFGSRILMQDSGLDFGNEDLGAFEMAG